VKLNFYARLLASGFFTLEDRKDLLVLELKKIMNTCNLNKAQIVCSFYTYSGAEYAGLVSQALLENAKSFEIISILESKWLTRTSHQTFIHLIKNGYYQSICSTVNDKKVCIKHFSVLFITSWPLFRLGPK